MTDDRAAASLAVGDRDPGLAEVLDKGLDEYNFAATGTSRADQSAFSVKVTEADGEIIGGLTGWTWAGLCGISMLWVHPDHRKDGWGAKILAAAEAEAARRGCDRVCVSSFTFQAPGFYQKYGYVETGRTLGIPGENEDVHLFKRLGQ
ncbi:GNAT family N-acetyltransferase [Actinospica sp.]|jgi:ribosomal protein S18 acetylase RimI-like enzyme|uniref:GNAT family N-acetyltransferase n=1 Tax=Actinospica sp. TaxID=1872142 RepID=UPI002C229FA2|nr:GNAT family N-acetyltransferase [Actinospica sp.]HWG27390.1 GNAT family N-acetyltransferase [Actinospica sp.]